VCASEDQLADMDVVRSAEIAAFVAAHRHPAGFAVALTIAATADSASSAPAGN
jgi:hypothetical protein